jgi:hypothetical protein
MVYVRQFSEQDRFGIGTFQSGDEKNCWTEMLASQ